jgi:hypothetical protein
VTNRNVSKMILFLGLLISLTSAVILIIHKAEAAYVISCFGLCTGFASSIMTYVNSGGDKSQIGGSGVSESSTSTNVTISKPISESITPKEESIL